MLARPGKNKERGPYTRLIPMCGIAGFWQTKRTPEFPLETLNRMGAVLADRGRDDSGIFPEGAAGIGLAFRRLSILDLSREGHQPIVSASGRYVIVFSGEVYNFEEIRAELGITRWRGHSDTEVMLDATARHFRRTPRSATTAGPRPCTHRQRRSSELCPRSYPWLCSLSARPWATRRSRTFQKWWPGAVYKRDLVGLQGHPTRAAHPGLALRKAEFRVHGQPQPAILLYNEASPHFSLELSTT
jgi:hypothetical protein